MAIMKCYVGGYRRQIRMSACGAECESAWVDWVFLVATHFGIFIFILTSYMKMFLQLHHVYCLHLPRLAS